MHQVRDNLIKTLEDKRAFLKEINEARKVASMAEDISLFATQEFLKRNIAELTSILKDVIECCTIATEQR